MSQKQYILRRFLSDPDLDCAVYRRPDGAWAIDVAEAHVMLDRLHANDSAREHRADVMELSTVVLETSGPDGVRCTVLAK